MKMISRRLEQLDSSMKAMQVAMEGRLPAQQQPEQQQEEHLPPVEEMVRPPIHPQRHNQRPEVYALVSRPIKLEFPMFSGGDPSAWIFREIGRASCRERVCMLV